MTDTRPSTTGDVLEAARRRNEELERTSVEYRRVRATAATGEACGKCGEPFESGQLTWYVGLPTGATSLYKGRKIFLDVLVCTGCVPVSSWWLSNRSAEEYRDYAFHPSFERSCPICERRIRYPNARYRLGICSTRCEKAYDARRKRDERAEAQLYRDRAHCATCGASFKPRRSDARYCSPACRQKAYRDRDRDG